jgi:hypothetical protein
MKPLQSEPSAPSAPDEPSAPRREFKRTRRSATGPLKGRPKPGTVEYEVFRSQSKGGHPYPWRKLDATAPRTIECTMRVNEWEHEVLQYVARGLEHKSLSSYTLEQTIRAALLRIIKQEGEGDDG